MNDAMTDRTYEALNNLRTRLPDLRAGLEIGSRRRWVQRETSPRQREQMDALVRDERYERADNAARGIKPMGASPAPLRLEVLDAERHVFEVVAELEAEVCDRLALTPLVGASPSKRITRIVGLLGRIAVDEALMDHVHGEALRLVRLVSAVLGDTEPVHRLDARCPHCGAKSLRAFPERELIACANASCRCLDAGCPCHDDRPRRHQWTYEQWPALAVELSGAEAVA